MKFAHIADCHVGAWREPRMRDLTVKAFERAIAISIEERVDFVLIAGDLFHTAIPALDGVKAVFKSLKLLLDAKIPLYFITGSHDYSPTGKTMLDLIEESGLGKNVFRGSVDDGILKLSWTIDQKTGIKLAGVLGRANQLDTAIYGSIERDAATNEPGEKIFLFHTSLEELKPSGMVLDSAPLSLLPNGCKYYAGGHVHTRAEERIDGKHIVYPGPLFPASFSELEELRAGGFVIVENWHVRRISLELKPVRSYDVDCTGDSPTVVPQKILNLIEDAQDALVLVRARGVLAGKPSDVPWRALADELEARGAYMLLRNTVELESPQIEKTLVSTGTLPDIESAVLAEQKIDVALAQRLMAALASEQADGEKKQAYEERVLAGALSTLREK